MKKNFQFSPHSGIKEIFSPFGDQRNFQKGFSVLEVLLASVIFVTFASGAVITVLGAFNANRLGQEKTIATQFATEGLEAVRSIRNQGFFHIDGLANSYCSSGAGVEVSGGIWTLKASGTSDTLPSDSRFTRTVTICDAQRSATESSDFVASGGITYKNAKKITATVTWKFNSVATSSNSVSLTTYLSDWRTKKGGILVYGDGGTSSQAVSYKIYNGSLDTWSSAASTAVVGQSPTASLSAVGVYSSITRNEKIAISRHFDANAGTQAIYAQVYDGNTGTWGNVEQLGSTWNSRSFYDEQNFDGVYLLNGDFMAVYSDNTNVPKFSVWDGSTWSVQNVSLQALSTASNIPDYIVARDRPGTNEVMVAIADQANATSTEYFSGGSTPSYITGSWTLHTTHASSNTTNTEKLIDFSWIPYTMTGSLIFSNASADTQLHTTIFTANGSGGGTWGAVADTASFASGNTGAMAIDTRNYIHEFIACDKTSTNSILCFRGDATPQWTNPTNNQIASSTDVGIERSFGITYAATSGAQAIIVYSDNTAVPKYKKYDPIANAFDTNATNLSTVGGTVSLVQAIPQPEADDSMFLIFDGSKEVSTVVWDSSTNAFYSSGGKALISQGTNGGSTNNLWADFAWDNY